MEYSISEIADKTGVSIYALRFYDREGLLPFVERKNGRRIFKDKNFAWLRIINCLKNTGMPLKDIREYQELAKKGDASLKERQEIILRQKEPLEEQIRFLKHNLKQLEFKAWYYEKAVEADTEDIHKGRPCNPTFEPDEIPKD